MRLIPSWIRGVISFSFFTINTLFWVFPIYLLAILKLILPFREVRRALSRAIIALAGCWVAVNTLHIRLITPTRWVFTGLDGLSRDGWYLVLPNHRSATDIIALQLLFHRRIPFLKFFAKRELIWVPFLGLAWWALDFLFIRRYPRETLEKNPELRARNLEATRRACAKFAEQPVSIVNFVEGTRFTEKKRLYQHSPYRHLLKPRAAGIAHVLSAMPGIHEVLDVTIVYPGGPCSFTDFLCGKVREVRMDVRRIPAPGPCDYFASPAERDRFHQWLNAVWIKKDGVCDEMLSRA